MSWTGPCKDSVDKIENLLTSGANLALYGPKVRRVELSSECKIEYEADKGPLSDECLEQVIKILREAGSSDEALKKLEKLECIAELGLTPREMIILGEYYCSGTIILYLGCCRIIPTCKSLRDAGNQVLETLAHELIHHLQFTGAKIVVNNEEFTSKVHYTQGCRDPLAQEANARVPYRYRPHEFEAFKRQAEAARLIQGNKLIIAAIDEILVNPCTRQAMGL